VSASTCFRYIWFFPSFLRCVDLVHCRSERGEEPSREKDPRRFQIRLVIETAENLARLSRQLSLSARFELHHLLPTRTMKRFPSPRCESAMEIVRALDQRLRAQPKSQLRLLKLQAITVTHSISRSSPMDVFQNSNKYPRRASVLVSARQRISA
jgi:hypothetical protein